MGQRDPGASVHHDPDRQRHRAGLSHIGRRQSGMDVGAREEMDPGRWNEALGERAESRVMPSVWFGWPAGWGTGGIVRELVINRESIKGCAELEMTRGHLLLK